MPDVLKIVNDIKRDSWDLFLENHSHSTVFQSPWMFDLFRKSLGMEPVFLAVTDQQDHIQAVLLAVRIAELGWKGYFSKRIVCYGGPLIIDTDKDTQQKIIDCLLNAFKNYCNKVTYTEFRNLFVLDEWKEEFAKHGFTFKPHLNFWVHSSSEAAVLKNISKSKLRQIKKSLQNGARIIRAEKIDQVHEFYLLLKNLYSQRIKKPLPDWSFFKSFFDIFVMAGKGEYLFIEVNNKIIGGIMCPLTDNQVIYEWYVCGLDDDYKEFYPSILATWAAIDYALKNHFAYFDFMGAGKPDEDYGVREFKSKFGGELKELGRFLHIGRPLIYNSGKKALTFLKKNKT
jgi:lipid II:glycine glycyltransferase (peptidoglycan interpeptide bridge formation enzyme)